jgi:hypothetical protein
MAHGPGAIKAAGSELRGKRPHCDPFTPTGKIDLIMRPTSVGPWPNGKQALGSIT